MQALSEEQLSVGKYSQLDGGSLRPVQIALQHVKKNKKNIDIRHMVKDITFCPKEERTLIQIR